MIGLGENFGDVLEQVEKVRKKELLYTIFNFKKDQSNLYEICESFDNPTKSNRFEIKEEAELRKLFSVFEKNVKKYGCCYSFFDFETMLEDKSPRSFLCLISMIPDDFGVKEKFLYSSHIQSVAESLGTSVKIIQINAYSDLCYDTLKSECVPLKRGRIK